MRIPFTAVVTLLLLAGPLAAAPRAPARSKGPTPAQALMKLKRAIARRDRAGEWELLSPGFKRRMNRRLGRHVDIADYTHARNAQRRNSQVRQAETAIRGAKIQRVRRTGRGRMRMSVWMGGPLVFGQSVTVNLIFLSRWEVWAQGEKRPYWGFVGDPAMTYAKAEDGSYTMALRDPRGRVIWQQMIPAHRVRAFRTVSAWYFDHLGELEQYIK